LPTSARAFVSTRDGDGLQHERAARASPPSHEIITEVGSDIIEGSEMDAATWVALVGVTVSLIGTGWAIKMSVGAKADAREALELSRRRAGALEQIAKASEPPEMALAVERISEGEFVLRNDGTRTASIIGIDRPDVVRVDGLPEKAELAPAEGIRFRMVTASGSPIPTHLVVHLAGLDDPLALPMSPG